MEKLFEMPACILNWGAGSNARFCSGEEKPRSRSGGPIGFPRRHLCTKDDVLETRVGTALSTQRLLRVTDSANPGTRSLVQLKGLLYPVSMGIA